MTGSNSNYAGGILLTANAGVNTSSSGGTNATGITISGPITDGGNNFDFYRFAFGGEGSLILSAANTYGGATFLGRQVNNYAGSVTILDFGAATAPAADILYHGLAQPGDVRFFGGNSPSVLRLAGAAGMENSQRLGVQVVTGGRSLTIGSAGSGGALSAGGATANTAGTLFLSNHSTNAVLEVGANIVNNGTGVVTVVVDDNEMACEDLFVRDLNGDGKPDIIAAGRRTKNVKVYWQQ
jgi:autotransporter-associated beta strand protein